MIVCVSKFLELPLLVWNDSALTFPAGLLVVSSVSEGDFVICFCVSPPPMESKPHKGITFSDLFTLVSQHLARDLHLDCAQECAGG